MSAQTQETTAPFSNKRYDIYGPFHRGLRAFMTDALLTVGRMDAADELDVAETMLIVDGLLNLCESHLQHENDFLHPAIESRDPGSSEKMRAEHEHHQEQIDALRLGLLAAGQAQGSERTRRFDDLYQQLALFVAENFVHMHYEETVHNAALWASHTDEELAAIEAALVASIDPEANSEILRWMLPANPHVTRSQLLGGMREHAPRDVFVQAVRVSRTQLRPRDWWKLQYTLGLSDHAGRNAA